MTKFGIASQLLIAPVERVYLPVYWGRGVLSFNIC